MIDVFIIDNENAIARFIDERSFSINVFDDEICALNAAEGTKPGVIIIYTIQKSTTIDFISALFKASVQSKIVLVANNLSEDEILDCLQAGAKGYLQINEAEKFMHRMIKAVIAGEAWISRRLVAKLLARIQSQQIMELV